MACRASWDVVSGLERDSGSAPVWMAQPLVTAADSGDLNPARSKAAMTCFAVTAGSGKLCHLEVERLGELRRYPVLVEHHLHGVAETGQGLFARVAVSVRPAGRPEPCVRAPDAVLILFDGDRDMHFSHYCLPVWLYATGGRP